MRPQKGLVLKKRRSRPKFFDKFLTIELELDPEQENGSIGTIAQGFIEDLKGLVVIQLQDLIEKLFVAMTFASRVLQNRLISGATPPLMILTTPWGRSRNIHLGLGKLLGKRAGQEVLRE